ncbi:hypothetical protein Bbelb_392710 [Branchiostoma belcheri]|nr:hypothetical protein Bbelb_392710 [Branchiostoma belcheri]
MSTAELANDQQLGSTHRAMRAHEVQDGGRTRSGRNFWQNFVPGRQQTSVLGGCPEGRLCLWIFTCLHQVIPVMSGVGLQPAEQECSVITRCKARFLTRDEASKVAPDWSRWRNYVEFLEVKAENMRCKARILTLEETSKVAADWSRWSNYLGVGAPSTMRHRIRRLLEAKVDAGFLSLFLEDLPMFLLDLSAILCSCP